MNLQRRLQRLCRPFSQSSFFQDDEIIEPSFIKVTPDFHVTLDPHYVKHFNSNGVCFEESYISLNDLEPFHAQY